MTYEFPYFKSYEGNMWVDSWLNLDLTGEEEERLTQSARTYYGAKLSEDSAINDIYENVFSQIVQKECAYLKQHMNGNFRNWIGDALQIKQAEREDYEFSEEDLEKYVTGHMNLVVVYPPQCAE